VTLTFPERVVTSAELLIVASVSLLISLNASDKPIETDTAVLPANDTLIAAAPAVALMLAPSSAETATLLATIVPPMIDPSTSVLMVFSV
jgi:hypothetical protein